MTAIIYIIALVAALALVTTAVAWWNIFRDPRDDLTVSGPASNRLKPAARLTAISFGLCGLAALLAVIDWFVR